MDRNSLIAALLAGLFVSPATAQLSLDTDWSPDQNGLTVASAQKVVAEPAKLRVFATLVEYDPDVRIAVAKLADSKKATIDKLLAIGAKKDAIEFAETRISEWNEGGERLIHIPRKSWGDYEYTAYAAVQVDWEINDLDGDKLIVKLSDLRDQIRRNRVFKSDHNEKKKWHRMARPFEFYLIVVGENSDEARNEAHRRGYEEANAHAQKIATITGHPLGKLETMTLRKDGRFSGWGYEGQTTYSVPDRSAGLPNPMLAFRLSPSEVYGSRASELYRIYTIELRFELK
jgi:hypothetical protein